MQTIAERKLKKHGPLRRARLGPLILASLSITVALWAQSLVRQPVLTDALILFGIAVALLVLASRRAGEGPDADRAPLDGAAEHAELRELSAAAAVAEGNGRLGGIQSLVPLPWSIIRRGHRLAVQLFGGQRQTRTALALLVSGILVNAYALTIFRRNTMTAEPWLYYLLSVFAALVGLWLLSLREQGAPEQTESPSALSRRREILLLALIVLVGAFFRLYNLDTQPAGFWFDEAMYGLDAQRVVRGETYPVYFEANFGRGALFIYAIAGFIKTLGSSALTVRLVAVVAGILTIPALYAFVKLLFGWRTAFVAALLLAVSRWHINFSRVAFDAILVPLLEVVCFYFLFRGLRSRRLMDFVWAGIAAGLGLNTYVAFRLVPFIAAFYLVYKVVFERRVERKVIVGLGALLLSGLLVGSPFAQFYLQFPKIVNQRADTVSVFAGKTADQGVKAVLDNTRKHLLMFNQRGDPNGRHNLPGEPMLDYVSGGLFVVGLGYALYRFYRPEYAFFFVWFFAMLSAGILSVDFEAPQALRAIGSLPVVIIFASLALDRLLRLTKGLGRVVPQIAGVAVALLLIYVGYLNFGNYFVRQAANFGSWNDFSTAESLMAKEMKALGTGWQFYVTSLYFEHPTVRFLAPGIGGYRRIEVSDNLPIRETSEKNVAIFLDPQKMGIFNDAKRFYPQAVFKEFTPPFGGPQSLLEVQLRKEDLQSVQGLLARYYAGDGFAGAPAVQRKDSSVAFDWATEKPLPAPFSVEWSGTLYAANYGLSTLGVRSPGAVEVWLDENKLLKASGEEARLRLPAGNHSLRVKAVVPEAAGRTELYWQPANGTMGNIPPSSFYSSPVSNNGLLGSYYGNPNWSGDPTLQRIDPSFSLYFHVTPLPRPYTVEWTGKVEALTAGDYSFGLESIDDSYLDIDGQRVVEAHVPNQYSEGRTTLTAGWHDIRVRYVDKSGWSHFNLFWTPPKGNREIVPTERLLPPQGSYPAAQAAPPAPASPPAPATGTAKPPPAQPAPAAQPAAPSGPPLSGSAAPLLKVGREGDGPGQLKQPKDVAVGADGSVFVADAGNGRVLRFDRQGGFVAQIGAPGGDPGQLKAPLAIAFTPNGDLVVLDEETGYISRFSTDGQFIQRFGGPEAQFYHPRGIAVGSDGTIYVADTGFARVVEFSQDGRKVREIGGKGNNPGQMLGPTGVTVDVEGKLWLTDVDNDRVQRLSPEGEYLGSFAIPHGESVDGAHLALGANGVYIADSVRDRVLFYGFDGRLLGQWGETGSGDGQLRRPVGIVVDREGNVWVAERDNGRVQKFRPPS